MDSTEIKAKVEAGITPVKAELIWFVILLLAIVAGVVGMRTTYNIGFRHGVYSEKVADLEDVVFNQREVKNAQK